MNSRWRSPGQQHACDLQGTERHRDHRDRPVDRKQDQEIERDEPAVEQRRQHSGSDDFAHGRIAVQAHHQIAGWALLKEAIRKRGKVFDESERHSSIDEGSHLQQQVRSDQRPEEVKDNQRSQRAANHHEQAMVVSWHDAIHESAGQAGSPRAKSCRSTEVVTIRAHSCRTRNTSLRYRHFD